MKLFLQVLSLFAVATIAGVTLGDAFLSQASVEETVQPAAPSDGQSLEVRPPAGDGPAPLDFKLQGSSPEEQKASGNLQNTQDIDDLQPNARTDLFQDDS